MKITIVSARVPPTPCGVGDHSLLLAETLVASGHVASVLTGADQLAASRPNLDVLPVVRGWGIVHAASLTKAILRQRSDIVVIQWVPYLYGRLGVSFGVPLAALLARLCGQRLVLFLHETWIDVRSPASWLISSAQRSAIFGLGLAARSIAVSVGTWTKMMRRWFPWKSPRITSLPVGSNLPRQPLGIDGRGAWREKHGIKPDEVVVLIFSPSGAGKGRELLDHAWRTLREDSAHRVRCVVIGTIDAASAREMPGLAADRAVIKTGYLKPDAVSSWLAAADVCLAPFTDGLTARRGSALAALQHGLPVVSTRGHLYDAEIFDASPVVVTEYDARDFAEATARLVADSGRRLELAGRSASFYADHLAAEQVAARILELGRAG